MDLRLNAKPKLRILWRRQEGPGAGVGRAVTRASTAAEAVAAGWIERTRPLWLWLARKWRRLGTAAAMILIVAVLLHAMFGSNGIVVYRQKRDETRALEREVERLRNENGRYVDQIKALKSDPEAIEKEAREQLHYARPGEVVLVAPEPPQRAPAGPARNDAASKP